MPSTAREHGGGPGKSADHTPGAVRDPAHDGRLKENREQGIHIGDRNAAARASTSVEPGHRRGVPGVVKDPNDGRLKQNREKGVHKGG
jgi:hypothetical protein